MGRDTFHYTRLLEAPSNLALNTAREGAATASLGNLCQCLTTLRVKNFFLMSKPTLFQFKAIAPCPVTPGPCKKSLSSNNTNDLFGFFAFYFSPFLLVTVSASA